MNAEEYFEREKLWHGTRELEKKTTEALVAADRITELTLTVLWGGE